MDVQRVLKKLDAVTTYRKKEVDDLLANPVTWRIAQLLLDRFKRAMEDELCYCDKVIDIDGRESEAMDLGFALEDAMAEEYHAITGRHYVNPTARASLYIKRNKGGDDGSVA